MPKNKGKYHNDQASAPTVEQIQTLTTRAIQYLRPHALKLSAVLGGLVVVLVGFSVYTWWNHRLEAEATRSFAQAMVIQRAVVEPEQATPPSDAEKEGEPKYKTLGDRSQASLAVLERLLRERGSAEVAQSARLAAAGLYYELERYDQAIATYRAFLASSSDPRLQIVAREGLGYALEAKALAQADAGAQASGLDEALRAFAQIQPDEKGFYADFALFHQARIKAQKGERADAIVLYKQVLEKFAKTPLRPEIENRIALLEAQG